MRPQYGANAARVRNDVGLVRARFQNLICEGDNYGSCCCAGPSSLSPGASAKRRRDAAAGQVQRHHPHLVSRHRLPHPRHGWDRTPHCTLALTPSPVWIPPPYPYQGPNIFISPTPDMAIKQAHQHVDLEGALARVLLRCSPRCARRALLLALALAVESRQPAGAGGGTDGAAGRVRRQSPRVRAGEGWRGMCHRLTTAA